MRSARFATSSPERKQSERQGRRLDWPDTGRRPPSGGCRAVQVFSRPQHGRGSLPGVLFAGAEILAEKRPAARSGRMADPRGPQFGHRQCAPPRAVHRPARRGPDFRHFGCGNRHRRQDRRLSLSRRHPAAVVCVLPSRPAGHPADCPGPADRFGADRQADRPVLSGLGRRHGTAHHPRQGAHRQVRRQF